MSEQNNQHKYFLSKDEKEIIEQFRKEQKSPEEKTFWNVFDPSKRRAKILENAIKKKKEFNRGEEDNESADKQLFKALEDINIIDPEYRRLFYHLNYQRVVNDMRKSVRKWLIGVFTLATCSISILYVYGAHYDELIPDNVVKEF